MIKDIQIIPAERQQTTAWSGGTTTQAYIYPPEASYAQRTFDWRLSTATVQLEQSDFTPLPDYNRIILPLDASLRLQIDGQAVLLAPLEQRFFDGGSQTRSYGKVRDYNLMLKKARATGSLQILHLPGGGAVTLQLLYAQAQTLALYAPLCDEAAQANQSAVTLAVNGQPPHALCGGDLAVFAADANENVAIALRNDTAQPSVLILAQVGQG